jgi:uncharacterized protein
MKFIALVFSLLLTLSLAACADDTATFNAMLALANKGDAEAQYHVGMMYNNGIGTGQDTKQAFGWFQKSAAANDALGAYKLGCYYAGQGAGVVEADANEALKYKLVAASAGYSLAQHDVAVSYAQQGNFDEAVKWLKMASDQGYDMSLYGLAISYHEGKGVPNDPTLAYAYLKLSQLASETGVNAKVQALLDRMNAKLSKTELEKAEKLVSEWKPQPTALTLKARGGITEAEAYLQKAKE